MVKDAFSTVTMHEGNLPQDVYEHPFGRTNSVYSFSDAMQQSPVMSKSVYDPGPGKPQADAMGKVAFTEFMNSNSPQAKSGILMIDVVL